LLQATGVAAEQIPGGLDARARLWREQMSGKRVLVILDDAIRHDQVRPLLPGTAQSLVLITSRKHLTALGEARAVSLDVLPEAEAAELMTRLADRPDVTAADPEVHQVVTACGYLPLAIGLLARQLHHHPAWQAADLAAELAAARNRLGLMHAEDVSVTAALDLSVRELAPEHQLAFQIAGLHPGTEIDVYAMAALAGTDLAAARHALAALYDHHLLTEPAYGRYRMHDLVRQHAAALAATGSADERQAAITRLLHYYVHVAQAASAFTPRRLAASPMPVPDPPAHVPRFRSRQEAARWMDAERLNLSAAADYAAANEHYSYTIAIASAMHAHLRGQGQWNQAVRLHQAAAAAAGKAPDLAREAIALADLGDVQHPMGELPAAIANLRESAALSRRVAHPAGEARALTLLSMTLRLAREYEPPFKLPRGR
jgi:hypothetical protein